MSESLSREVIGAAVGYVLVVCEAVVSCVGIGPHHYRVGEPCAVWLACPHVGWVGACVAVVALKVGECVGSSTAAVSGVGVEEEEDVEVVLGDVGVEGADATGVHVDVAGACWRG